MASSSVTASTGRIPNEDSLPVLNTPFARSLKKPSSKLSFEGTEPLTENSRQAQFLTQRRIPAKVIALRTLQQPFEDPLHAATHRAFYLRLYQYYEGKGQEHVEKSSKAQADGRNDQVTFHRSLAVKCFQDAKILLRNADMAVPFEEYPASEMPGTPAGNKTGENTEPKEPLREPLTEEEIVKSKQLAVGALLQKEGVEYTKQFREARSKFSEAQSKGQTEEMKSQKELMTHYQSLAEKCFKTAQILSDASK